MKSDEESPKNVSQAVASTTKTESNTEKKKSSITVTPQAMPSPGPTGRNLVENKVTNAKSLVFY